MNQDLNTSKTAGRPSHEAIEESHTGDAEEGKTAQQRMDRVGMESAKRAENRIHNDEGTVPGTQIFTK